MNRQKMTAISAIIETYFEGIFYGDIEKLKDCFTEDAYLYGDIKGRNIESPSLNIWKGLKPGKASRPQRRKENGDSRYRNHWSCGNSKGTRTDAWI